MTDETECFCPRNNLGAPGVSCGDRPKDYRLGPLPPTAWVNVPHFTYTSEDMRAYAAEQVAAERERCAKVCETHSDMFTGSALAEMIRED